VSTVPHVYDSAQPGRAVLREIREIVEYRGLLKVVVQRDVVVRYKRSMLGLWWALLNPLGRMLVMWVVLQQVFNAQAVDVPYIVYLLSGIVVFALFEQGVIGAGASIVTSSGLLTKVHVPAQIFAMVTGIGLMLAAAAVRFYDVMDLSVVLMQLLAFLTPTFYPLDSVSPDFRFIIQLNPLTEVINVMRGLFYKGTLAPLWEWAVVLGGGAAALALGITVFSKSWRSAAVML